MRRKERGKKRRNKNAGGNETIIRHDKKIEAEKQNKMTNINQNMKQRDNTEKEGGGGGEAEMKQI